MVRDIGWVMVVVWEYLQCLSDAVSTAEEGGCGSSGVRWHPRDPRDKTLEQSARDPEEEQLSKETHDEREVGD